MALFESYERREKQILAVLKEYGINSIEEAGEITKAAGLDVYAQVEGIQPICFENAKWAYTVGAAIAIKKGCKRAADAAAAIGESQRSRAIRHLIDTTTNACCVECKSCTFIMVAHAVLYISHRKLTVRDNPQRHVLCILILT